MDAIVIAGGLPEPGDPLYEYTQGQPKALLDIAGKPMVQWVLDALGGAETILRVVLIGLSEDDGLDCAKEITYVPNQGGMLQNVRAGMLPDGNGVTKREVVPNRVENPGWLRVVVKQSGSWMRARYSTPVIAYLRNVAPHLK